MKSKLLFLFSIIICLTSLNCYAENKANLNQLVDKTLSDMTHIPSGTYIMGPSNPNWQVGNDTPPHKVHLSAFYMSRYNVSYGRYDVYSRVTDKPLLGDPFLRKHHYFTLWVNHPVNNITWFQANDYCQWLRKKTGLPFSLPTEAQWEYVARDLGKKNWPFATNNGKQELGKNFPSLAQVTHQKGNFGNVMAPLPVGSLPCTPMGICGMGGEVNQWVKDWYSPTYYGHSPVDNPQGPKTGTKKTIRGGGAGGSPSFDNVFNRYGWAPTKHEAGFRCVINSDLPMSKLTAIAKKHLQG